MRRRGAAPLALLLHLPLLAAKYDHSPYTARMRAVVAAAMAERDHAAPPRLSGNWTAVRPGQFEWTYRYPGTNGTAHVVRGPVTCDLSDATRVVVVFMKMTSNALERAMFDAFRASLAERAQRPADRYAQCFLEPVFATTCERSRRCIPKFMEGVAAKVAFSHDVLARMAPGQLMCFLDTDTVALRSLAAVVDAMPSDRDLLHMAEDPSTPEFANTGFYVARRTPGALRYLSVLRSLMAHDASIAPGASGHDQMWANFIFVHLRDEAPIAHASFPWRLVGAAAGGTRSCDMAVYHAIYTRDYRQKHDWQLASYRNTAACARGEVASQVVV